MLLYYSAILYLQRNDISLCEGPAFERFSHLQRELVTNSTEQPGKAIIVFSILRAEVLNGDFVVHPILEVERA
jgi:hypothetical protein